MTPDGTPARDLEIAELRRVVQELRESEQRLRSILEAALDAIITIDHQDRILEFNPAAEAIFRLPRAQAIGRELAEALVPPEMRAAHRRGLERIIEAGPAPWLGVRLELRALRADGTEFPMEMTVRRLGDADPPRFTAFIRDVTQRRRAEAEARRQAARLAGIVESQRELAMSRAGEADVTQRIAQMAQRLLGADGAAYQALEEGRLVIRSAWGLAQPHLGEQLPLESSLTGLAVREQRSVRCDDVRDDPRVHWPSVAPEWRSLMASPLLLEGSALGVIAVTSGVPGYFTQDDQNALELLAESLAAVLQHRRDSDQLRASELQYRSLFLDNPQAIFVYEPRSLQLLAANTAALAQYGYTDDEMQQLSIAALRPQEDLERWRSELLANPRRGPRRYRDRHRRKNGDVFDVEVFANEIAFHGARARVVLAIDITEQQRAARELRESEERFRALTELSSDWYWEQDEELRFLSVSSGGLWPRALASAEALIGRRRWEIPELEIDDWAAHRAMLARHEAFRDVPIRRRDADGSVQHVLISGTPVFDEGRRFRGYRGIGRDVTAQHVAQQEIARLNERLEERVRERTAQLESANAELEAFSYSIAHDLRSPLTSIDGFSRVLEELYASALDDKGRHYLQRIQAGVQQMSDLTDAMLSLAHLSRVNLRSEPVDLAGLARQVFAQLREREPQRDAELDAPQRIWAEGDPRLLAQVVNNLVGNAWKFSARAPRTLIRVDSFQRDDGTTVYFVADRGAGFDMAHAWRLFGAFQRLHAPSEFEGTGIGLALVQKIVNRHGGRIWAEAQPGAGATFYFTLPGQRR